MIEHDPRLGRHSAAQGNPRIHRRAFYVGLRQHVPQFARRDVRLSDPVENLCDPQTGFGRIDQRSAVRDKPTAIKIARGSWCGEGQVSSY
jgi:hypothetical protein